MTQQPSLPTDLELVGSDVLWRVLGYRSPGAFRQAAHRGQVPVPLMSLPHRRGRYALRREVTAWLHQIAATSAAALGSGGPKPALAEKTAEESAAVPGLSAKSSAFGAMAFGAAIRAVRIRSGAMQKAIALSSEIDQSVLAGWESGRRPAPRAKQLQRLLKALSPSVEERNRILLAWELARLSRSLHGHDEAFKETVLRLASWLAAMSADERAAWCAITGRLQPALLRKEGTMA